MKQLVYIPVMSASAVENICIKMVQDVLGVDVGIIEHRDTVIGFSYCG